MQVTMSMLKILPAEQLSKTENKFVRNSLSDASWDTVKHLAIAKSELAW